MYCDSNSPPPILTSTLYAHMTLNWFSVIVHACKLTHTTTYIKWQQHWTHSSYHIQCNTEKGPQHTILILRGGPTQLHGKKPLGKKTQWKNQQSVKRPLKHHSTNNTKFNTTPPNHVRSWSFISWSAIWSRNAFAQLYVEHKTPLEMLLVVHLIFE